MRKIFILAILFIATMANCQVEKILGRWTTIDDKTDKPAGLVEIYKADDGLYYGKLVDTFGPNKDAVGTMIVRGMKYEDGKLTGGKVFDPESGKLYYCTIKYDAKEKALKLRGSLDKKGLLGRNQTWVDKQ